MYWHKATCNGLDGVQIMICCDDNTIFRIYADDEAAARRVMKNLRRELEHTRSNPELYEGNAKTVTELE